MKVWGTAKVLNKKEIELISENALKILSEIGIKVPHNIMLEVLNDFGAIVDREKQFARFPQKLIADFFAASEKVKKDCYYPITFHGGAYPEYYMLPRTTKVQRHTLKTVADMTRLADYLDNVDDVRTMGVPSDVPPILAPLYMRLITWKYSKRGHSGQIQITKICPYAVEMGEIMAENEGGKLSDYVYLDIELISPLQVGREEAQQFVYFWKRGLRVNVGNIITAGGTGPATLAGALSLNLAENLFINILDRVFYNQKMLHFYCSVTVLDMKTAAFRYGRPELGLTHLAMGQIARHHGGSFNANSFLGDAKVPSCEMGMQKGLNAIPAILAGSRSLGTLGLLSVDEIGSPIQLIIDNEFAGALKRFNRGFEVNGETLAFDLIKRAGPGGLFTGTMHTVEHYKREHWQPSIFSREMYNSWLRGDGKVDVERAQDIYDRVLQKHHRVYIKEETEKKLLKVIDKAKRDLLK